MQQWFQLKRVRSTNTVPFPF
ncbi:hypothetical protein EMIT047CA2_20111 [Pseudomonas soli]